MKRFHCDCGQIVFFDNTHCVQCDAILGFDPETLTVKTLRYSSSDKEPEELVTNKNEKFRQCRNQREFQACNWLLPADSQDEYCRACRCNQTIPNLTNPQNLYWWRKVELAKRHMLYGILSLNLPLLDKYHDSKNGLAFAFIEDRRHNPHVEEYLVQTGHHNGLITINLAEANDAYREQVRRDMGESYRTLLGHFRHEVGHYYFDRLLRHSNLIDEFRKLFGDEQKNYDASLQQYYAEHRYLNWQHDFISAYAQVHPLEDWAECWAHYLHIRDGLETAEDFEWLKEKNNDPSAQDLLGLNQWLSISLAINALNRSLGMTDAYPFALSATTKKKLHFVHQVIHSSLATH